jgi:hypothetical protein
MPKRSTDVQFCLRKQDRKLLVKAIQNDPCISYEELARQFGISSARVGQIAQEEGLKLRPMEKFTRRHVIDMRERYHTKGEHFYDICPDYPWASTNTVRAAILGDSYRSIPMPLKVRKRNRRKPASWSVWTEKDVQETINMAFLFSTGLFTIEDVAGFFQLTRNELMGRFKALRRKGFDVPDYSKSRKGIPDFQNVDIMDLLIFSKKHRHKMQLTRKSREKSRKKK